MTSVELKDPGRLGQSDLGPGSGVQALERKAGVGTAWAVVATPPPAL